MVNDTEQLNMTLQAESSTEDTENLQDWSSFSTLWNDNSESKPFADVMDFSSLGSMGMDMDFNPSMSIEPSALHYDPTKFTFSYDDHFNVLSNEILASQFPFAFQATGLNDFSGCSSDSSQSFIKERRLSITSSSSSSGASLSPVPESIQSPPPVYASDIQPKEEPAQDPADALAQRVRQSAGVMLAVPMNAQLQELGIHIPENTSKLPIPRLPRHNAIPTSKFSNTSVSSSAASTPPPSTPPQSTPSSSSAEEQAPAPAVGTTRPKTSHTTIERRYRTNLNARIQSLRMAVPALRVLEDREGGNGKKIKKNVKGNVLIKGSGSVNVESEDGSVDVIDERGFVDGVKVARKCSKANVLGKAVEYIRVLKKREHRLKAEQAGLKTLISGLVGGPALVREWEREWRANFGGEEKDEVEGEDEEADDDDSDEEEGEDGDEDGGRKRKRPKSTVTPIAKRPATEKKKATSPTALEPGIPGVPEKRKRGRPRKVLPPAATLMPVASSPSEVSVQDEPMLPSTPFTTIPQWTPQQQTQPQQYLLAVFALFSFFNSPLTSSSAFQPHQHHTGAVLSAAAHSEPTEVWAWKEYLQVVHLIVSILVLASFLGNWLGISRNFGVAKMASRDRSLSVLAANKSRKPSFVSWADLARNAVLQGDMSTLSFYECIRVYRSIFSQKPASVSDLTTLAIILNGATGIFSRLAAVMACRVWAAAATQSKKVDPKYPTKISEQLVLETLTVQTAANYLAQATQSDKTDGERPYTPIEVLGSLVVKERIKRHLAGLFIRAVADETDAVVSQATDEEWRRTLEAANELGGDVTALGKTLELAWKADVAAIEDGELALDSSEGEESGLDGDISALLTAVVLYRRLFATTHDGELSSSTLLSPPPTPTTKTTIRRGQLLQALRTVLGNGVFEEEGIVDAVETDESNKEDNLILGLEDARDQVVDMIFDSERRLRAASSS